MTQAAPHPNPRRVVRAPKPAPRASRPTPPRPPATRSSRTLAEARGYERLDLLAIAEMGRHYLRCGGYDLAEIVFAGLAAIAPGEPYHHLALGLTRDHRGDRIAAAECYRRASELDPLDGRGDVNLGELELEAGRVAQAIALFRRAAEKSRRRGDEALEKKANALIALARTSR
jgi:tetratricopeptide (TPR) repeat protein